MTRVSVGHESEKKWVGTCVLVGHRNNEYWVIQSHWALIREYGLGTSVRSGWTTASCPGGSDSKESALNAGHPGSIPGSGGTPGEGNSLSIPAFLSGEFHGQKSVGGCSPWFCRVGHDWGTKTPLGEVEGENVYRGRSDCLRRKASLEKSLRTCSLFVMNHRFHEMQQAYLWLHWKAIVRNKWENICERAKQSALPTLWLNVEYLHSSKTLFRMCLKCVRREGFGQFLYTSFFIHNFIYFWLCGSSLLLEFFSTLVSGFYSLVAVCRPLIAVASLVVEHGLSGTWGSVDVAHELNSCRFWDLEHKLNSCDAMVCCSTECGIFLDQE